MLLGLRAEESRKRRDWLIQHQDGIYRAPGAEWRCSPIWDWRDADVWGYIAAHNVPINAAYLRFAEAGVERRAWRVGPLPLVPRATLEAGWPDMLARLEARYGERWR